MRLCNLVAVMYDVSTEVAVVSSANKMFEAMMMSRPYIGSAGGFPGIVAERLGVGFPVPYGDPEALISLIDRLAKEPGLIEQAARKGRQAYCERFRWEAQEANLRVLYGYLTDGQTPQFWPAEGWSRFLGTALDLSTFTASGTGGGS